MNTLTASEKTVRIIGIGIVVLVVVACSWRQVTAQTANAAYSSMAPVEQYLMERTAEIALARSAAPESISHDAEVLVLGRHGYETEAKGKNGFVCMVERSWTAGIDDPEFWNPKLRAPICFNPPATRSYLPLTIKKTELVLAGRSKAQMFDSIKAAFDKRELPTLESGAMCYMMSRQAYLGDRYGNLAFPRNVLHSTNGRCHLGAGLPGSPIMAFEDTPDRLTVFIILVDKWSDGTAASMDVH